MKLKKIKKLREERGISGAHIARKLGYKHPQSYHALETGLDNGTRRLDIFQAKIISDVFGLTMEDLFLQQ